MAWISPPTRPAGTLISSAIWNQDIVANTIAINAGAIALTSQGAGDFIIASSASQLDRVSAASQIIKAQVFN